MKKTILSFLLVGSAAAVMAQQPTSTTPNTRYNQNQNTNLNQNQNPNLNRNPNTNLNNNNSLNNPVNNQPVNSPTNTNTPPTNISSPEADTALGQQPYQPMNTNTMNNTMIEANTNTYSVAVPTSIQTTFTTSYPGVTGTWQRSGDWYQARYVENGMIKQVMYREDGKTLTSSISPIKQSFVPDEMVAQAIQRYGASLYAIGASKSANGRDLYRVTVIENGQAKTEWMNADGSTADDHFRTAEEPAATGTINNKDHQMNSTMENDSSQHEVNVNATDSSHQINNMNNEQSHPQQHSTNQPSNPSDSNSNGGTQDQGINNANATTVPQRRK